MHFHGNTDLFYSYLFQTNMIPYDIALKNKHMKTADVLDKHRRKVITGKFKKGGNKAKTCAVM